MADLAVLDLDYFVVSGDEIQDITSVLMKVDGKVVHAGGTYAALAPPSPPAMPDWFPT